MSVKEHLRSHEAVLWGALLAEFFVQRGGEYAVISPGSRSAPLAYAFHAHEDICDQVWLDERSAAFFALGLAKSTQRPVALICTSGSAAAHYMPAIIEAFESGVPLLLLTADRPPELRDCGAGQTINQLELYGSFVGFFADLPVPSVDESSLDLLRDILCGAFETLGKHSLPVHLNVPFREPLHPQVGQVLKGWEDEDSVNQWAASIPSVVSTRSAPDETFLEAVRKELSSYDKGWIVVGYEQGQDVAEQAKAYKALADRLGMPVLDGGLSGLRGCQDILGAVAHYEPLLMNESFMDDYQPEVVLMFGAFPTSKRLRAFLDKADCELYHFHKQERSLDPTHRARAVSLDVSELVDGWEENVARDQVYASAIADAHQCVRGVLNEWMEDCSELFEGKLSWLLPRIIPREAAVCYASSMPVRDLEFFWGTNASCHRLFSNRGANGIDGTLSTAMGIARGTQRPAYLVTGDLAFLHDSQAMMRAADFGGALTILLINNDGGGIFQNLPHASFEPPFSRLFLTPQRVDIALLCEANGVAFESCRDWRELEAAVLRPFEKGVRVLEIRTDKVADSKIRKLLINKLSDVI